MLLPAPVLSSRSDQDAPTTKTFTLKAKQRRKRKRIPNSCFSFSGVKEMFAGNNEPFTTEPIDREVRERKKNHHPFSTLLSQFFRRNLDGFLVCGPERRGFLLFELGQVTPFMPQGETENGNACDAAADSNRRIGMVVSICFHFGHVCEKH